jgi:protein AaeX
VSYYNMNFFGVYIAPFVPMLIVAGIVTGPLLRLANSVGLSRWVWHPALFNVAIYLIVLYVVALAFGLAGAAQP